jgi:hypothetical protein
MRPQAHYLTLTARPNQNTKEKTLSWNHLIRSAQETFCYGDILLQETFRYGDVVRVDALYGDVLSRRRFVEATFCRGDILSRRRFVCAPMRVTPPVSGRQQCLLAFMSEHTCRVRHTLTWTTWWWMP